MLVLTCSKHVGKRAWTFKCSLLIHLGFHINFSKFDLLLTLIFSLVGNTVDISVSLHSAKLHEIQQLAHALLWNQHVTIYQVMSFLGKTSFCASGHAQLGSEWHVKCLSLSCSFISFVLLFTPVSAPEAFSDALEFSSLAISSFWCGCHFQYYAPFLGLLYSGLWDSHLLLWHLV